MPVINLIRTNKRIRIIVIATIVVLLIVTTILLLISKNKKTTIQFVRSTPIDQANSVNLTDPISVEFNIQGQEAISANTTITYKLDPNTETSSFWKSDQVLTITPQYTLAPDTKYTLDIYQGTTLIKELSFTTKSSSELTTQEKQNYQTQSDFRYAQSEGALYQNKPWLKNLPIDNNQFVAVYDPTKDGIFVKILEKTADPAVLQTQIKAKLITAGVPPDVAIEWSLP